MNQHARSLLEFDRILKYCADSCLSSETAERLLASDISSSPETLAPLSESVRILFQSIEQGNAVFSGALPPVAAILKALSREGYSLSQEDAFALAVFLDRGQHFVSQVLGPLEAGLPLVSVQDIPEIGECLERLYRILDKEGKIRDLPSLRAIRARLRSLRGELDALSSRWYSDESYRGMLQSSVPTQRDGRTVLAVKANFKGRVRGIVHEVSSTGQTIFVEPEELIEKNNQIRLEEGALAVELAAVFRELSNFLRGYVEALLIFHEKILLLDSIYARCLYSRSIKGSFALLPNQGVDGQKWAIRLVQARHPLLGKSVVPVDLSLRKDRRMVIITGPNTGGKTVALKTVGLFAMMNQFGLAIPAEEGSVLPVFDDIFADIGDEQSISQSLSTFSAHMTNISRILSTATSESLLLLDELGSGTDPQEGAAIAMAILQHCLQISCMVFTTTHHGVLKNFGYSQAGVENASMEFNAATLSPTYKIVMGIPGESRALEIAARNGLPAAIVALARSFIDQERADVSELIKGLKEKHRELEERKDKSEQDIQVLREKQRKTDLKELQLRQKEQELKSGALGDLRGLLTESRKTLENLVRSIKEQGADRSQTLQVKEFLSSLETSLLTEQEQWKAEQESLEQSRSALQERELELGDGKPVKSGRNNSSSANSTGKKAAAQAARGFYPGLRVKILPTGVAGRIIRAAKKGHWMVEAGSMRLSCSEANLQIVAEAPQTLKVEYSQDLESSTTQAVFELNLRGMRLDEALEALRRQLDAAALSGLNEFSVIHGKGDGILQHGVHSFLKEQHAVSDFGFCRPEEGGHGKTRVSLKR